ncbi:AraC family transcriptional regulator [Flavobacterium agricola]|uniref:AraC family transcriptional regulator n=1 Tax=Flavobacterium agricola TaxID=2870839 RepID=A0ABY6LZ79_9FLAO|nr:AraC family transcriptional regulator [Flavobacterium agricola]UYW00714.1 AraC family transcriptional regulator [Flavobacterium agricola]
MYNKVFFQGLYGSDSIEFARGLINVHPFGEIGKNNNNKVEVHAHNNLFQIFYIESGITEITYQNKSTEIEGPSIITIPKNTPHGFIHHTEVSGWIISLSDSVLESLLNREAEVLFTLYKIFAKNIDVLDANDLVIINILKQCVQEYNENQPGKLIMLQNLVGQLIIHLYRLQHQDNVLEQVIDNSYKVYFRNFMMLIAESRSFKKTIDEYAQELRITTTHLTRVTKNISNKSPREVIVDYYISEAKLLLSNLKYNINEVARELDIEDPSYFSRLFKKKTGITPKEFQRQIKVKA